VASTTNDFDVVLTTYAEVKRSHPDWSEVAVEDYMARLRDVVVLADNSDDDRDRIANSEQNIAALNGATGKLHSRTGKNDSELHDLAQLLARCGSGKLHSRLNNHDLQLKDIYQLLARVGNGKLKSMITALIRAEDKGQSFTVVEAGSTYQVLPNDDAINCDGTFTVTLLPIADAIQPIIITSTSGTITVAGNATIQGSTSVTTGTSAEWYPARGEWWRR
jgi:hypothetical protein